MTRWQSKWCCFRPLSTIPPPHLLAGYSPTSCPIRPLVDHRLTAHMHPLVTDFDCRLNLSLCDEQFGVCLHSVWSLCDSEFGSSSKHLNFLMWNDLWFFGSQQSMLSSEYCVFTRPPIEFLFNQLENEAQSRVTQKQLIQLQMLSAPVNGHFWMQSFIFFISHNLVAHPVTVLTGDVSRFD